MIASATHDTKLGEDVRARLNVALGDPRRLGARGRPMDADQPHAATRSSTEARPPIATTSYRFYQALLGVWPADASPRATTAPADLIERLQAYMLKSVKEAKVHASWLTTEPAVRGCDRRVRGADADRRRRARSSSPRSCRSPQRIARLGLVNSLAQLTLKLGSPGIPDFYQGTELWDLVAGRSRQPPAGGLRAPRRLLGTSSEG